MRTLNGEVKRNEKLKEKTKEKVAEFNNRHHMSAGVAAMAAAASFLFHPTLNHSRP